VNRLRIYKLRFTLAGIGFIGVLHWRPTAGERRRTHPNSPPATPEPRADSADEEGCGRGCCMMSKCNVGWVSRRRNPTYTVHHTNQLRGVEMLGCASLTQPTHFQATLAKVDDNIHYPDTVGGCFVKGTMVHTREGLKRIEEIKIGDYVLSSPEDGSGKPEYKRVLNTFVYRNKSIREIACINQDNDKEFVAATGNHPFWVEGTGWTRADRLKEGDVVRFADGGLSKIDSQFPVYRFPEEKLGIGWVQLSELPLANPALGYLFDYANYALADYPNGELDWEEMTEENYLEVTVYNLEVEDFHTYYVSHMGIWVHNTNCAARRLGKPQRA
jgi:hypothetical protein